jgi:hypothetical protein
MTTKIQCPHCAQRISAPDDVLGSEVECPTCNRAFVAIAIEAPPSPPPVSAAQPRPQPIHPSPRPHSPLLPARKRGKGTAITVTCALAVIAGGIFWWQTQGPGFPIFTGISTAKEKRDKGAKQKQELPAAVNSPGADGTIGTDFQGVWQGKVPRTVVAKPYDVPLAITFNERGEGFPKFETPEDDAKVFAGAGVATLFQTGGKDKVILLREWEVTLSTDKKTMTWTEVGGPAKVKFTKQ